jgi:hypothetical protein
MKSQYEMLKLSTKCWISAFNAQSWRGVTVPVRVGAVKIYVAAVEALKKKERQSETQESSKLMVFWVSTPLNANVLFCRFFFWISPCVWPNSGYRCCLFLTLWISLLSDSFVGFLLEVPNSPSFGLKENIGLMMSNL